MDNYNYTEYEQLYDGRNHVDEEEDNGDSFGSAPVCTVTATSTRRWNHVKNLDKFFTHLYEYHEGNGMLCMATRYIGDLIVTIFIIFITLFCLVAVDFDIVFENTEPQHAGHKVYFEDIIYPSDKIHENLRGFMVMLILLTSFVFVGYKIITGLTAYNRFRSIKEFYNNKLNIHDNALENYHWQDITAKVIEIQVRS